MAFIQGKFLLVKKQQLTRTAFRFNLVCPDVVKQAKPGQFVHVLCEGFSLRRPISISEINFDKRTISIVFEVRGEGTLWLSKQPEDSYIDILGPLGNGFNLKPEYKKIVVVGGGIGVPPLLELCDIYNLNASAILGFRNKDAIILQEDFESCCKQVVVCTDDGSCGVSGVVTNPFEELIIKNRPDCVFTCGPLPMIKAVVELCLKNKIECQVSLEEKMACGVGACLVCACKIKGKDDKEHYKHVCKDGPVFMAEDIVF